MAVTVLTILLEVLRRGGWCEEITASSGTTTTVVDAVKLKDTGESIYAYEDLWAFVTEDAGATILYEVRRVESYSPTSGTLSVGNAFSAAPTAGDKIQLCAVNPELVKDCVITALRKCTYAREDSITWTTGINRVDLSAQLNWISMPEQILRIRYRTVNPSVPNQFYYTVFPPYEWSVEMLNGTAYVDFESPLRSTADSNTILQVKSIAPYVLDSQLTSTFSYTSSFNIPLDWIVSMSLVELLGRIGRNVDLLNRGMFRLDQATEARWAEEMSSRFSPPLNYNVRLNDANA